MGRPTASELETALREAARLREHGLDEHHLAKAVLNLHDRVKLLEEVFARAKLYLHSGEGAIEHAQLLRAIEHAEEVMASGEEARDIKPW